MLRVQTFPCSLAKSEADALDRESGRHCTDTLVWHYRIYRRTGHWLSEYAAKRLENSLGGQSVVHAHSRDAAQEGFYNACTVTRSERQAGLAMRHPHRRKWYRTTTWKHAGIRSREDFMFLSSAKGLDPIRVSVPEHLRAYVASAYKQVELVWDPAGRRYHWHVTLEDCTDPARTPGATVIAVDLGEIHPAAVTDGQDAVVITARRLRTARHYTAKRLADLAAKQPAKRKGSRRWKQLQRRKNRFLAQQQERTRDSEHKVSRAVVDYAVERRVGTIAMGDVRDVADGKRMGMKSQQQIGVWPHGKTREYSTYKAKAEGISVELTDEHDSSRTCPFCGCQHKPRGRVYRCPVCGLVARRDAVGSVNILSRKLHGELAKIPSPPLPATKYRYPAFVSKQPRQGKCSSLDTRELARVDASLREAAEL